jgi:hypothetical protein
MMAILSFLRRLNVKTKNNNKHNTPAFARANATCPKTTLIIAVSQAMQSKNKRILSIIIN